MTLNQAVRTVPLTGSIPVHDEHPRVSAGIRFQVQRLEFPAIPGAHLVCQIGRFAGGGRRAADVVVLTDELHDSQSPP
jgi:hypothetical protein